MMEMNEFEIIEMMKKIIKNRKHFIEMVLLLS